MRGGFGLGHGGGRDLGCRGRFGGLRRGGRRLGSRGRGGGRRWGSWGGLLLGGRTAGDGEQQDQRQRDRYEGLGSFQPFACHSSPPLVQMGFQINDSAAPIAAPALVPVPRQRGKPGGGQTCSLFFQVTLTSRHKPKRIPRLQLPEHWSQFDGQLCSFPEYEHATR